MKNDASKNAAPKEASVRFEEVSFGFGHNHPILKEVSFTLRKGMKVTLMGQNGAGKSTLFKLITQTYEPEGGKIVLSPGVTIATANQAILPHEREMSVRAFFESRFAKKVYDIDPR
jgi:ABC-type bacteriocin/lantibiotic exporter with double-glycine peptidase domain